MLLSCSRITSRRKDIIFVSPAVRIALLFTNSLAALTSNSTLIITLLLSSRLNLCALFVIISLTSFKTTHRLLWRLLKETGGEGRVKITGIRAEESSRRARRQSVEEAPNGNTSFVHPILKWPKQDVWQFIHDNNLPYCSLYDEGFERIGCVLCPFQSESLTKRDLERFPAIADYYRRACRKSFQVNKDKFSDDGHSWQSGDDIFNWWISERKGRYIAWGGRCQLPLFADDDNNIT